VKPSKRSHSLRKPSAGVCFAQVQKPWQVERGSLTGITRVHIGPKYSARLKDESPSLSVADKS
jgi:hypothetical protein